MSVDDKAILAVVEHWARAQGFNPHAGGSVAGRTPWAVDTQAMRFDLCDVVLIQRLGADGYYRDYWNVDLHTALVWALAVERGSVERGREDVACLVCDAVYARPLAAMDRLAQAMTLSMARDALAVHADRLQSEGDPFGTTLALWLADPPRRDGLAGDMERLRAAAERGRVSVIADEGSGEGERIITVRTASGEDFVYTYPRGVDEHNAVAQLNRQGGPATWSVGPGGGLICDYWSAGMSTVTISDPPKPVPKTSPPASPPIGRALARRLGRGLR